MRLRWRIPLNEAVQYLIDRHERLSKKKNHGRHDLRRLFESGITPHGYFGNALLEYAYLSRLYKKPSSSGKYRVTFPPEGKCSIRRRFTGHETDVFISQMQLIAAQERIDAFLIENHSVPDGVKNRERLRWINAIMPMPPMFWWDHTGSSDNLREVVRDGRKIDVTSGTTRFSRTLLSSRKKTKPSKDKAGEVEVVPGIYIKIPEGRSYELKRWSVYGKEDAGYIADLQKNHWTFVPPKRHPKLPRVGNKIMFDGLVLMERPRYLTQEAKMEDLQIALDQRDRVLGRGDNRQW